MSSATARGKEEEIMKRRIHISSKRQITIPAKYFKALNLKDEVDCIYAKDMLVLVPVQKNEGDFSEEILEDLIEQGFSGKELIKEFKRLKRKVRPAVEQIVAEADVLAREAMADYVDRTEEIFENEENKAD